MKEEEKDGTTEALASRDRASNSSSKRLGDAAAVVGVGAAALVGGALLTRTAKAASCTPNQALSGGSWELIMDGTTGVMAITCDSGDSFQFELLVIDSTTGAGDLGDWLSMYCW